MKKRCQYDIEPRNHRKAWPETGMGHAAAVITAGEERRWGRESCPSSWGGEGPPPGLRSTSWGPAVPLSSGTI